MIVRATITTMRKDKRYVLFYIRIIWVYIKGYGVGNRRTLYTGK